MVKWKDYPPHEYKVHRRIAGGGFVCHPNFRVRKSTDDDTEVTCSICLHHMREQDRAERENMTDKTPKPTPHVLAAAEEKIARLDGQVVTLSSDKRALEASLATEKADHQKTKDKLASAQRELSQLYSRDMLMRYPDYRTAYGYDRHQVAERFVNGLMEGLRGRDPASIGYELARRFG